MGLVLFNQLRDSRKAVGLPPIDVCREDISPDGKVKAASREKEERTAEVEGMVADGERLEKGNRQV